MNEVDQAGKGLRRPPSSVPLSTLLADDREALSLHPHRPPARFNSRVEWVIALLDGDQLGLRRMVNGRVDESYAPRSPAHLLEMVSDVVAGYSPAGFGMRRRTERQDVLSWPAEVTQSPPGT